MPRSIDIVEIWVNDDLREVIRKCNYNFRQYMRTQSDDGSSIVTAQDDIADVKEELARQVDKIIKIIDEKTSIQDKKISELESKISDVKIDIVPNVGTWLYADYDPNSKWPGTKWEKVAEGTFLISAGSKYEKGKSYGSNDVTLTVDQIPSHRHLEDMSLLQWTSDDGSGPGNVSATNNPTAGNFGSGQYRHATYTSYVGGSKSHTNIPKSIAVPLWHRTA